MSLGDIDIDPDETELFVTNLFDRRIYRYDLSNGQLLDRFDHGAVAEPWARDARPFALKRRADGRLYHGVTNSSESSRRREDLAAYVYSSLPDGSDMRLELSFPLTYPRGTVSIPGVIQVGADIDLPLDWLPWDSGYLDLSAGRAQMTVYPQPLVSDIEFMADGAMLVAVHDRHADMTLAYQIQNGGTIRKPGIGIGDLVRIPWVDGAWDGAAADPEHFGQPAGSAADRHLLGGLGYAERSDQLLANRIQLTRPNVPQTTLLVPAEGVVWYDAAGNPLRLERTCFERLFPRNPVLQPWMAGVDAPQHSEWLPGAGMGDLEVLCGPTPTPSPSPTSSPSPPASPSLSPTPTATATRRPSATPSPTATRPLTPIYLPLIVTDPPCDPGRQAIDVVLVIDASTTMRFATRAGRPKVDAAIEAARRLLDRMRLPGDQAAIVVFNADAQVLSRLTGDRGSLDAALGAIDTREFTRIHLGLDAARELLAGAERVAEHVPAVIMLTDGRSNPEPVERALEAAARLKADGVRLFTVGLGEDVEQDALRRMASRPEDFRYAPDGEDLGPIYEQIAIEIPCPPERNWPYRP
ncbi:MAG: VWA domain-containing protein, partial [Chloroflexi bacterium]|nr:VWA domain-containing protein [Chloroflexota bacterium]